MNRKIFADKSFQNARVFVLAILALILFFCDRNLNCFTALRSNFLLFVATPTQKIINLPTDFVSAVLENLSSKRKLIKENASLHSELLLAYVELQKLKYLEQENLQLSALLKLSKQLKTKFVIATVSNLGKYTIVDKGKNNNLFIGQLVVDAHGLFGQVIAIEPNFSTILLITDIKSAIPVIITRNGVQAISIGTGHDNSLELVNIPETTDIKTGDFLVTSGVGQRFPKGYAVGNVREIKHAPGERFIKVLITPSARINSSKNVLLAY